VVQAVRGEEPLHRGRTVALALALTGIILMIGLPGTAAMHPVGVTLALSSALIYSAYLLAMNRLQIGVAPPIAAAWVTAGVALLIGAVGALAGSLTVQISPVAWVMITALAVLPTVLSFVWLYTGLAVLGPVRTSIISTVEPFCTAILGRIVLGQPLTIATLAGGALIAAAVLLLHRGESAV
jgi:drug/metabolite transporter (DMT)-like permease